MSKRWLPVFALVACLMFHDRGGHAAELGIVILDRGQPPAPGESWPAAEQRTRAELSAVGLSVVYVDAPDLDPRKPVGALGRAARERGAVAGVRLVRFRRPSGVEIWVVDEVTGKSSMRRVATENLPESEAIAVVALAVVELLNASLLELRATRRPHGSKAPTAAVMRMVETSLEPPPIEPYSFALRGGGALAGSPGGLGLMAGPLLGVSWGFHPNWMLEAEGLVGANRTELDSRAGQAQVGLGIGRLQLVLRGAEAEVQPMVGLGAGVLWAWASGEASERYRATDDLTAVFLPSILVAAAIGASSSFRLRLALNTGFALPRVSTTLAGEPGATAGRPLLDGSVALEWVLGRRAR